MCPLVLQDSSPSSSGRIGSGIFGRGGRRFCFIVLTAVLLFGTLAFGAVEDWAIFVFEAATVVVMLLWTLSWATTGRELRAGTPAISLLLLGLVAAAQIAVGTTAYRPASTADLLQYAACGMLFFVAADLFRDEQLLKTFAVVVAVFGFLYSVFAILQDVSSVGMLYWVVAPKFARKVFGSYVNHNHYAGLMEMLTPFPLLLSFSRMMRGGKRLLVAFAAVVMGASIFLSLSRGGILSFVIELVFLWLLLRSGRRTRRTGLLFASLLMTMVVLLLWVGMDQVLERATVISASGDESSHMRLQIAKDSIPMVREKALLGWGLGTFPIVYPRFRSFYTDLFVNETHNDYLQLLVEMGVIGFGLLCWFLVEVWRCGLQHARDMTSSTTAAIRVAALIGITGMLVHSLFDFNLHLLANAGWFFVLCAIVSVTRQGNDLRLYPVRFGRAAELPTL